MEPMLTPAPEPWIPENTFGARLALIRQHWGWNVKEAALACGLDPQSWRNWEGEKGCRTFEDTTRKIARAAGCDLGWLRGVGRGPSGLTVTHGSSHSRQLALPGLAPRDHLQVVPDLASEG